MLRGRAGPNLGRIRIAKRLRPLLERERAATYALPRAAPV
jgi:hypothetical protein